MSEEQRSLFRRRTRAASRSNQQPDPQTSPGALFGVNSDEFANAADELIDPVAQIGETLIQLRASVRLLHTILLDP